MGRYPRDTALDTQAEATYSSTGCGAPHWRARASKAENALARFRPDAVVQAYRDFPGFPLDCFLDRPMEHASEGPPLVRRQIERLTESGILKPPPAMAA